MKKKKKVKAPAPRKWLKGKAHWGLKLKEKKSALTTSHFGSVQRPENLHGSLHGDRAAPDGISNAGLMTLWVNDK